MTTSPIKPGFYGFLIDPHAQQISRVEFSGTDTLQEIYKAAHVDIVDVVYLNEAGDGVFVDDEGLLKGPKYFFYIEGTHSPLAGRGVVLGVDGEGESIAPTVTLDWLRAHTAFVHLLAPGVTAISSPSKLAERVQEFFA